MGLPNEGCCGKRRGPRAAMGSGRRARGGLCTGRDREGRSLGEVEEGVGMLTVEAIELWWPNAGDRRGVLSSVQKQGMRRRRRRWAAWLDGLVSSMGARKAGWGAFYRRSEAVEEGARLRALQLVNGSGAPRVRPALLAGECERRGGEGDGRRGWTVWRA